MFGSVLHGRDTEASDLDVLVDPIPGTTLLDLGAEASRLAREYVFRQHASSLGQTCDNERPDAESLRC